MKKNVLFAVLGALVLFSSFAQAHDIEKKGRFGLGGTMGWPGLGLSTNTFVANDMSVQAELYTFWKNFGGFAIDVDFLFWLHETTKPDAFDLTWFAGPGIVLMVFPGSKIGNASYGGSVGGAFEGAVGLTMQFNDAPVDLTFQLSPGIAFSQWGADFWITGMVSSHYYF